MDKTNPNMHDIRRRITELRKGNPALPVEEWGIVNNEFFHPVIVLCGHTAAAWDDPNNPVNDESRLKAFQLVSGDACLALMENAVSGAVGARKEVLQFYKLTLSTMYYHVAQNTEEGATRCMG